MGVDEGAIRPQNPCHVTAAAQMSICTKWPRRTGRWPVTVVLRRRRLLLLQHNGQHKPVTPHIYPTMRLEHAEHDSPSPSVSVTSR